MASTSSGNKGWQRAPARHARAADEVGVREWAELLVERGEQLLARAKRQRRQHAPDDERAAPPGSGRRHSR
jgi:hypothetical protein